ncbi:hypothetical protein F5Y19DRAFT_491856 [Xylariaceae sp. FL1651]|nr:hypothetical protein F5Y19DRAFT_491856 [Xylariaceae sp. FL1651]
MMSEFPECNRIQRGFSCSCPTCMRMMLVNNIEVSSGQQQHQAEPSCSGGHQAYAMEFPTHVSGDDEDSFGDDYGAPIAPMGSNSLNDPSREDIDIMQLRDANAFSAINARRRQDSCNSSVEYLGTNEAQQLLTAEDQGRQRHGKAAAAPAAATERSASAEQPGGAKTRPKRKSKYNDDPPQSIYGPPFVTREITAGMSEDEIHRRIDYNAAVAEARKAFMRHKNNLAAKKSRERKQALIDDLTAEAQRLGLRLRQIDAANRELADAAARAHAMEGENARLRQENDALCGRVDDLTRRLNELTVERQRDADRLNAMLALPQPQPKTQAQPAPAAAAREGEHKAAADKRQLPQQQQQHQHDAQDKGRASAEMNVDMELDNFFDGLNNNENGTFGWDHYN